MKVRRVGVFGLACWFLRVMGAAAGVSRFLVWRGRCGFF